MTTLEIKNNDITESETTLSITGRQDSIGYESGMKFEIYSKGADYVEAVNEMDKRIDTLIEELEFAKKHLRSGTKL